MTILHVTKSGLTLKRHDYGFPIGVEYRLSDGCHACNLGEMTVLNDAYLDKLWSDYLDMKFASEYCNEEMQTFHAIDND